MAAAKNNIWAAMKYTPPRGPCNYKTSLISPACPCLRFMLHPVKAITSFECDGCSHHASFHALENPVEDAILSKWAENNAATSQASKQVSSRKRKQLLIQAGDDSGAEEPS